MNWCVDDRSPGTLRTESVSLGRTREQATARQEDDERNRRQRILLTLPEAIDIVLRSTKEKP